MTLGRNATARAGDGSDADPARDQARGGVRLSSDGIERGENLARVGEGPSTRISWSGTIAPTVKQACTKVALKRRDGVA